MNCIFCKIINGESPGYIVFEDKTTIAFLDIFPFVKGHTLIVPKKHSRWIWDSREDEYISLMKATRQVANKLKKAFATDWIQVVIAGKGVLHTHIHLLPRSEDDGYPEIPTHPIEKLSEKEMILIQNSIKNSS